MSNNQVIELNGSKYNALTGQVIAGPSSSPQNTKTATANTHPRVAPATHAPHVSKIHQKTAKSHTLMRSAVKKPITTAPIHNVSGRRARPANIDIPKHQNVKTSSGIDSINPHRVARAQHVAKSGLVSKFGQIGSKPVTVAEVPVRRAPVAHHSAGHHAQAPAAPPTMRVREHEDPFEAALKSAVSHEQPRHRKPSLHHRIARKLHIQPRTLLIGAGGLSILVIGGFVAYTRVPSVALKVAATKAGIHATLPAYQPAGFSLKGPIAAAPGEVSLQYQSNSDNRDFKVTQKTSSWNSETLLHDHVAPSKQASYQTFQSGGRTIYIYDGANATWVDGGIWYKIEGNSSLNSDQLLRIANSL